MSAGLFYTTRNVTGAFSAGLLCNLKILETQHDHIDFLTINKTEKPSQHLQRVSGLKVFNTLNWFGHIVPTESWDHVYGTLDVSALAIYDALYIMGGIHFPQSKLSRGTDRAQRFPINDKGQLKFQQVSKHMVNIMAMHKAHICYGIPLHEFSYETDEMATSEWNITQRTDIHHIYHVYDIPKYGMKRLDSLQYYFNNKARPLFATPKVFDLIFGYTLYANGNRPAYVNWIDGMKREFPSRQIFVKDAITKNSNTVSFERYLELIQQAKYTLVVPSYDANTFSMYRFIEAIQRDCLPILHPDCNVKDAEKSFGIDLTQLMVNKPFSDLDRQTLVGYYKDKLMTFEKGFR